MIAVLDLDGWQKEVEIPPECKRSGIIMYAIYAPLDYTVRPSAKVVTDGVITVRFHHTGKVNRFNKPIYKA